MDKPDFLVQSSQDIWPSIFLAMVGEVVLSLGNLSTQYAWAFVGLSVTEVITASITDVIGTTLNYFLDDKINKAEIFFPGVACFLISVCFGSSVHASNAADNQVKLSSFSNNGKEGAGAILPLLSLIHIQTRVNNLSRRSTIVGLAITFFAGICFSLFSPAFNLATIVQWHTLRDDIRHLSFLYCNFLHFSVSCSVVAIALTIRSLYHPILNLPRSSIKAYLLDWNG